MRTVWRNVLRIRRHSFFAFNFSCRMFSLTIIQWCKRCARKHTHSLDDHKTLSLAMCLCVWSRRAVASVAWAQCAYTTTLDSGFVTSTFFLPMLARDRFWFLFIFILSHCLRHLLFTWITNEAERIQCMRVFIRERERENKRARARVCVWNRFTTFYAVKFI